MDLGSGCSTIYLPFTSLSLSMEKEEKKRPHLLASSYRTATYKPAGLLLGGVPPTLYFRRELNEINSSPEVPFGE